MWYNSTGWNCLRQLPLPQFATSEQIAAPCKGKRFLLQNGVVLQKKQEAQNEKGRKRG
jgi:nitrite reductase/ring-hydroxylating ferredoxin subunit